MRIHERKKLRLQGFNYASNNKYFVTICVKNFASDLGEVKNSMVILSQYGLIVRNQWLWLAKRYPYVRLDEFIIMPDHFHGIIEIDSNLNEYKLSRVPVGYFPVGRSRDCTLRENGNDYFKNKIKSLSELMGAFKTTSSKYIHKSGNKDFKWHKSFYDRIIRSESEFVRIRKYIKANPANYKERQSIYP